MLSYAIAVEKIGGSAGRFKVQVRLANVARPRFLPQRHRFIFGLLPAALDQKEMGHFRAALFHPPMFADEFFTSPIGERHSRFLFVARQSGKPILQFFDRYWIVVAIIGVHEKKSERRKEYLSI